MITLRCTKRLRILLNVEPLDELASTTAALGDWYANLIPTAVGELILITNEKSLLSVVIPVSEADSLEPMFQLRVARLFGIIGIPVAVAEKEISQLSPIQYAKTASRIILGTMNDFAFQLQWMAETADGSDGLNLSKAELDLSECPCGAMGYQAPSDVAKSILLDD